MDKREGNKLITINNHATHKLMKHFISFLFLLTFLNLNSQVSQNDSLLRLLNALNDEPKFHSLIKTIVIGYKGCNIQSATNIQHEGQFKEYKVPFPKNVTLENLQCDYCKIDSSNSKFNVLNLLGKDASFGITNDCKPDGISFKISPDSIFTLSNAKKSFETFEELKKVEGFGGKNLMTDVYLSIWLHPSFEIISLKENIDNADFKYIKENDVELKANNIYSFVFELKYQRKGNKETFNLKKGQSIVLKNIQFEANKAILLPSSYTELNKLLIALKNNSSIRLQINGHTSINDDSEKFNNELSTERAKAVREYLFQNGISEDRIIYKGFGCSKPIYKEKDEEHQLLNRRVEIEVLSD